jgi:hypothetical protein
MCMTAFGWFFNSFRRHQSAREQLRSTNFNSRNPRQAQLQNAALKPSAVKTRENGEARR